MLYDIKLTIDYDYAAPIVRMRNLLRLLPRDLEGEQRVVSRLLVADPLPEERRERLDFFGNAVSSMVWMAPLKGVEFTLTTRIERFEPPARLDLSPGLEMAAEELAGARSLAPNSPHHFIGASRRAALHREMSEFARAVVPPGSTMLGAIEAVGRALHAEMRFDAEATDVNTPAREAFAKRHGVCQDFSHVMIACLRGIGIPAGYVSGFLRTLPPPGKPRLEGADAMHAWVSAWAGAEMGWVEYDPTNAMFSGADHIKLGYGRDYDDVAPVRGAMRGQIGAQKSKQAVDVIAL